MHLSCSSLFLWEYTIDDIMDILGKAGIKSVEFWAETPFFWMYRDNESTVIELIKAISKMPEGCTLHAPIMDLNPSSYNDLVHDATVRETLWAIELAGLLKARVVTIHPGKRTAHRKPVAEDWKKLFRYLEISIEKAQSTGMVLSLENSMPGVQSMCSDPHEMKEVIEKFPELFFTFDVVHALLSSPEKALSFIDELGDKIINVHVGAPHNGKPHFPMHHEKKMDFVLRHLRDSGYENDLTIEIDDKTYPGPLSKDEKILELTRERKFIESIFNEKGNQIL